MSAAIQIKPPPPPDESPPISNKEVNGAKSKPVDNAKYCRNVVIFGSCKFEGKGCAFVHPPPLVSAAAPSSPVKASLSLPAPSSASSVASGSSPLPNPATVQAFVPTSPQPPALAVLAAKAAVFVPKKASLGPSNEGGMSVNAAEFVMSPMKATNGFPHQEGEFGQPAGGESAAPHPLQGFTTMSVSAKSFDPSSSSTTSGLFPDSDPSPTHVQEEVDESEYYHQSLLAPALPPPPPQIPLNYHLYSSPLPHISNLSSTHRELHRFFVSDTLRQDLQERSEATWSVPPPAVLAAQGSKYPEEVHVYHSLLNLELGRTESASNSRRGGMFGYKNEVVRAQCSVDGNVYCLRRIEGFKLMHESAFASIEAWRKIRHPSIVNVREAFTTRLFGDHSVIFAYDFHPRSQTLFEAHLTPKPPAMKNGRLQPVDMHVPEKTLWSYVVQIAGAIRRVHKEGLAIRCLDISKILLTGKNRVRINCCGILDVLTHAEHLPLSTYQVEDLLNFGKLLISLACNSTQASSPANIPASMERIQRGYSSELSNVIMALLSSNSGGGIEEFWMNIQERVSDELENALHYSDAMESDMTAELENSRLVRLLCKFGFINERPEFDHDLRWSESGDRYILKLFRDMVFHQVDEVGNPVLDLSHVLTCLNKLDAGSEEKVMLVSRDEQSCLVVSYKEIRDCVDAAFKELARLP